MSWDAAIEKAIPRVMKHEGFRSKPYRDTVGKLTIGYGRNLDDVGITEDEGRVLLGYDLINAAIQVDKLMDEGFIDAKYKHDEENAPRLFVLVEMVFNMGVGTFKEFKGTVKAFNEGNWDECADHMLDSKWAKQVGQRAVTLAGIMRTNNDDTDVADE